MWAGCVYTYAITLHIQNNTAMINIRQYTLWYNIISHDSWKTQTTILQNNHQCSVVLLCYPPEHDQMYFISFLDNYPTLLYKSKFGLGYVTDQMLAYWPIANQLQQSTDVYIDEGGEGGICLSLNTKFSGPLSLNT